MVLAGLLRGQLSDQQRLHELAHEIKVTVEGTEGILGSRAAGGEWESSTHGGRGSPAAALRVPTWTLIDASQDLAPNALSSLISADPSVPGRTGATPGSPP